MKILIAAAEAYPLIKTGGLADVAGALPIALRGLGHDARLLLPAYRVVVKQLSHIKFEKRASCEAGNILLGTLPSGLPLYLLDSPMLFDRDGDPYHDGQRAAHQDNFRRFAALSLAAAVLGQGADKNFSPDVLHINDWHTALTPLYFDGKKRKPKTVLSIHNLAYQGEYSKAVFEALKLPAWAWRGDVAEHFGKFNMLKSAISLCDRIIAVSPRYAEEIKTPLGGCGLDWELRHHAGKIVGLLNGIDPAVWDPAKDKQLASPFNLRQLDRRAANKAALQKELRLKPDPSRLLVGFVGRLTLQKGADIILDVLPDFVPSLQFALLGTGEKRLEHIVGKDFSDWPGYAGGRIAHDEALSHRMMAGCDALVVPSRFEPCGLVQMYALRYGCLPVVRRVGGLADTVTHSSFDNVLNGTATGVVFNDADAGGLRFGLSWLREMWNSPQTWKRVQKNAMLQDNSWAKAAQRYVSLYTDMQGKH